MLPTQPPRKGKKLNTAQLRAQVEGETIDNLMAQLTYETICYAKSFADGSWHPSRRTLFQIANQFPKN